MPKPLIAGGGAVFADVWLACHVDLRPRLQVGRKLFRTRFPLGPAPLLALPGHPTQCLSARADQTAIATSNGSIEATTRSACRSIGLQPCKR
jgi:hypothetical protein